MIKKLELTVRVMLGVSNYTRVKMQERPKVGYFIIWKRKRFN